MERHINLDGTYMNVIQFGNGPRNLSVIAGVSLTSLEGMGKALEDALGIFSDHFTVYVFDRKKLVLAGYTIENMADDIYRCLKELGVEHTSVYGASQGGMIGQVMAIRYPEMVDNLVVCSTICKISPRLSRVIDLWLDASRAHDVERVNTLFLEYVYSQAFIDSIKDSIPELIKNGSADDCDRFVNILEAIKSFDVYDSLDKIQCPTLVIADSNDKVFGTESSYIISDRLNCKLHIYDKYSHAVYDESPDIKSEIMDFITSCH